MQIASMEWCCRLISITMGLERFLLPPNSRRLAKMRCFGATKTDHSPMSPSKWGVADFLTRRPATGRRFGATTTNRFERSPCFNKWGVTELYQNNNEICFNKNESALPKQANINTEYVRF